jgi:uncharacterized protein (TIGR03382 family)
MTLVVTAALGAGRPALAQQSCTHARVLIVLDKSSSMVTGNAADGQLKWNAATSAVETLVETYGDTIDFGLMLFPDPSQCSPGSVKVDVGPATAGAITAALATPPPDAGNYTPMAESLDEALAYLPLHDPNQRNYVLLVTDGWQWCDPYDAGTRFDAVTSVENLAAAGIDTFVLGFGASVDVLNNNRMAAQGNTAKAGCNPEGTDAAADDLCYYQTESQSELEAAFDAIAGTIVEESCDGQDNDCDGFVDNAASGNAAPLSRNVTDVCGVCVSSCTDGSWSSCATEGECDDSNACTENDFCAHGTCAGTAVTCADDNPCTADSCDPASGCRFLPVAEGTPCDDGNACTSGDQCAAGACTPGANVCGDTDTTPPPGGVDKRARLDRDGCGCAAGTGTGLYLAAALVGLVLLARRRR